MSFTTLDEAGFPVPVLAQVDAKNFEICVPFKFRHQPQDPWTTVPKDDSSRKTDLASVPGFLLWFVPRYGVHTLAALAHDQLVDHPPPGGRVKADTIFRDLLGDLNVPWIRRWLMWTAVSLGTTWHRGNLFRIRLALWVLTVVCAASFIWQQVIAFTTPAEPLTWAVFGHGVMIDFGIIALASVFLAPRIGLALLGGGATVFLLIPTVVVVAFSGVYLLFEKLARSLLSLYNAAIRVTPFSAVDNVPAVMSLSAPAKVTQAGSHCPPLATELNMDPTGGDAA